MADIEFPTHSITRNGIEIELEDAEIRDIYYKMDAYWKACDVHMWYYLHDKECPWSAEECYEIGDDAQDYIWGYEEYGDCYWKGYQYAIEDHECMMKKKGELACDTYMQVL